MAEVTLKVSIDNKQFIRGAEEAQRASQKLYDTVEKGQKTTMGRIEREMIMQDQLREKRKKAFDLDTIEKYNKLIADSKKRLDELETAGTKVEKTQQSMIQSIGKWAAGIVSLTAIFGELFKTFKDTVLGLNLMTTAGEVWSQMTYNMITANNTLNNSLVQSIAIGKQINELRKKERTDLVEIAKLQNEYNRLYFESADRRKSDTERIKLMDEALAVHNKMVDLEIENLNEQRIINAQQLVNRPKSNKLLDEEARLNKALQDAEGSRWASTKRIEAQRTGLIQEGLEREKRALEEAAKAAAKYLEQLKKINSEVGGVDVREGNIWIPGASAPQIEKLLIVNEDFIDRQLDLIEDADKKEKRIEDERLKRKREIWNTILAGEQAIFDMMAIGVNNNLNRELIALDRETQAKLNAAEGDATQQARIYEQYEAKKLEIEKKYRREQQKIAIAQTVISGAQAIAKTFAEYGYTPAAWVANALLAALMALQIGVIKAQKFAKGGWTGKGGMRDDTGERMAGVVHEEEFVVRRGPAHRFREVLEAINKDNHSLIINKFNKLVPEGRTTNIIVENEGPNKRLDQITAQLRQLNRKQQKEEILQIGATTVIRKGNSTRVIKK